MAQSRRSRARVGIVGIAHTPFGKLPGETVESLVERVTAEALADAGLEPGQVDEVILGHYNGGLVRLAFGSTLAIGSGGPTSGLAGIPMSRVENAGASGAAAVHQGIRAVLSGLAETVLVVGVEKMTHAGQVEVNRALAGIDPRLARQRTVQRFASLAASLTRDYAARFDADDWLPGALAKISAKNHCNAAVNPWAHRRAVTTPEFCGTTSPGNPIVVAPLRRSDCSPVSDGAAAIVLRRDPANPLATITGYACTSEGMLTPDRDVLALQAGREAAWQALSMAKVKLERLSLIELHDSFSILELLGYEMLGLVGYGQARRAVDGGWTTKDGRLPVNPSGGLLARGHPLGASAVSAHVMVALQVAGQAGAMQVPHASHALVHSMGGFGVVNYASLVSG
ncbi:MAG: thiolase C-terminal domain-containing protein [Actinomycetales bacterium]